MIACSLAGHQYSYAMPTRGLFTDVEVIPKPDLRIIDDFVLYWDAKRAGRLAPRPADIEPSGLVAHRPNTFVVDVLDGGADFRYRCIGKRLAESLGRDSTGQRFSGLYRDQPAALARMISFFNFARAQRHPIYVRGRIYWLPSRDDRKFAAALAPMSDDGHTVTAILGELFVFRRG